MVLFSGCGVHMADAELQGIVLAGGKSQRFGEDKACFLWQGKTLLQWSVDVLLTIGLPTAVVTAPGRNYAIPGIRFLYDEIEGQGPLGGLWTACRQYPGKKILLLTCDMLFPSSDILRELVRSYDGHSQVALFETSPKRLEPFPGLYDTNLEPLIGRLISQEKLAMHNFFQRVTHKQSIAVPQGVAFPANINTKEDLAA